MYSTCTFDLFDIIMTFEDFIESFTKKNNISETNQIWHYLSTFSKRYFRDRIELLNIITDVISKRFLSV